ncbi:type IX secretion system protein PorG [Parapedobacter tibetensis]|uniref:type IX secretion system protein PorG n=1 Tax=Parapedobacter tibetensis TaxID=2972951 RepID=UPI00214D7362|nr:porin family protein [Parapedobacter tibetensis]
MHKGIVMLLIALGLTASRVNAQEWEFGALAGVSGYMGDLNPENPLAYNDWSAAAFVKYNLNHTWGIRGNFAYANIFAYDIDSRVVQRQERNLNFFGNVMEASLLVDFNFFKWLPQRGRIVYTPYIFAGVGGTLFEPKWYDFNTNVVKLREYQTEDKAYSNRSISIPFGAGFKYNLRGPWSIGVEIGYRLALTDYLDDVSGFYPDFNYANKYNNLRIYLADPSPTNMATPNTQRGDGRPYDSYMVAGLTVSYTIFKGGCPEWR